MSIRYFGTRILRHGREYVRSIWQREYHSKRTNISAVKIASHAGGSSGGSQVTQRIGQEIDVAVHRTFALRNVGAQVGLHARRILIDNVLNRVTNSLSSQLRERATKRIFFGDSSPFFALVGVGLASGASIITKEEELEGVCFEIREAISKMKWNYHDADVELSRSLEEKPLRLDDLELAHPIAKGANAVVYAAKLKETRKGQAETLEERKNNGRSGLRRSNSTIDQSTNRHYPLAVKMMFNYDVQSNAFAILKAMHRETIPVRFYYYTGAESTSDLDVDLSRQRRLPPHPNIVTMFTAFADRVPELRGAKALYPAALPARIYADGAGRNMSLFLVMKRYECSLQQFLSANESPSTRTRTLLLAQLLEAVAYLGAHRVAHRDLKSDNVLLDSSEPDAPTLVLGDFGCCLADENGKMTVPYGSRDVDIGGNAALMAPEIVNQRPGTFSVLNYRKSDLWACGAIAYEIFGHCNPFYDGKDWRKLRNVDYDENDLPELAEDVPDAIKGLIKNLLARDPKERLDAEVAANVCQLMLWAPSTWLKAAKVPTSSEILQWLLCLATKVLCEGRLKSAKRPSANKKGHKRSNSFDRNYKEAGRRTYPEYLLISSFLCRAKLANVRSAISFVQNNNH